MLLAMAAGVLSGVGNILFIATVNSALHLQPGRPVFLVILCIGVVLLRFFSDVILIRLSEKLVYELRMRLSRDILAVPLRRIEVLGPHSLFATLTEDIGRLAELALNIPNLCVNATIVVAGMVYLFLLSARVMFVVALAITLGTLFYILIRAWGVRHFHRARECHSELMKHFRALTDGVKEMKLNATRKANFVSRLDATAGDLQRELVTGNSIFVLAISWAELTFLSLISILVLFGPGWKSYGLAPAVLSGTVLALLCIRVPMESMVETFLGMTRAQVSLNKIDQLGVSLQSDVETAPASGTEAPANRDEVGAIEMRGVWHSYHSETDNFTLGPLDLSFRAGEMVFISGGNGSGKTTFIKLLTGLYTPEAGCIRWNDNQLTESICESYRANFSIVFSDFHLSNTIARPVSSELDGIATEYLHEFQLDHKVTVQNGIFSTTDLSQGQRKRLALIAACLEDRPIYVFDEWAADQDASFRQKFYRQILPRLKIAGKTLFVITHDQQYFDAADRLIVLEEGRVWRDTGNSLQFYEVATQMHARTAPTGRTRKSQEKGAALPKTL